MLVFSFFIYISVKVSGKESTYKAAKHALQQASPRSDSSNHALISPTESLPVAVSSLPFLLPPLRNRLSLLPSSFSPVQDPVTMKTALPSSLSFQRVGIQSSVDATLRARSCRRRWFLRLGFPFVCVCVCVLFLYLRFPSLFCIYFSFICSRIEHQCEGCKSSNSSLFMNLKLLLYCFTVVEVQT